MAVQRFRYRSTGPGANQQSIRDRSSSTATFFRVSPAVFVDIDVDDAFIDDLDAVMATRGFDRLGSAGPSGEPGVRTSVFIRTGIDALALDLVGELTVFENRFGVDVTVTEVHFIPNAGLVANAANFARWTIRRRDAGGVLVGTVATIDTSVTGLTAFTARDFGAISQQPTPHGEQITFEQAKLGLGVIVPAGVFQVLYRVGP